MLALKRPVFVRMANKTPGIVMSGVLGILPG